MSKSLFLLSLSRLVIALQKDMSNAMVELAAKQPGFLGVESARSGVGITVSYWRDQESIVAWKRNAEHQVAQKLGRQKFYAQFKAIS